MWNALVGTRSHRVTKIASPESLQCFCVCTDGKLTPLSCTFAALFVSAGLTPSITVIIP